jgi:alcohol dehydrogenase (cytochrome c)
MDVRVKLLALAALVFGASLLGVAQNPAELERNPLAGDPAAIAAGDRLFRQACAACHSDPARAPSLSGGTFARGNQDAEIFRTIRNGIAGTQMVPFRGLTTQEIWQVIAYLRSLANPGAKAAGGPDGLPGRAPGDPVAGEALFVDRAGCISCHQVNGRGGIVGPDLSSTGTRSSEALRRKILDPNSPTADSPPAAGGRPSVNAPTVVVARAKDGREIEGVRRNEDTFSLQMVDASGRWHLLDKTALAEVRVENRSLMPGDFGTRLSGVDLQNLLAYLGTLDARDLGKTSRATIPGGVTFDRLRRAAAEPENWLHYWGDYQGTHFSALKDVTTANVGRLQAKWALQLPGSSVLQATPLVVDGVMYTTGPPGMVVALDARTGRQMWRYTREQRVRNPYEINPFNRGVAILGHRLFYGTLDAALIALDSRTGLPLWEVQVADTMEGYSITSPPLALRDRIIVGVAGGEFATRGFIDAYDAATGRRLWRFHTIPGPGEFGNDTWAGDSWKTGGGATWLTGSYDPDLNRLYWAVGNPAAQIDRSVRGDGDNLFSDSVVALDPDTGERRWHYQFTPNDGHDWDSCQDLVLVDRVWRGEMRKLLLHADRNGHFYVLDRTTGRFLSGTPFVYQNWNKGFDANGRPIPVPGSNSSREGSFLVYPTIGGATNLQAPSYSPVTGWMYLAYSENGQRYVSEPAPVERGRQYLGRGTPRGTLPPVAEDPPPSAGIKAIDPETGTTIWDFKISQGSLTNGVLATAGGVLFAATREGNLVALDAATGRHLWRFQTGASMAASPMSYAVEGRQYVAISAGNVLYSFALPE